MLQVCSLQDCSVLVGSTGLLIFLNYWFC